MKIKFFTTGGTIDKIYFDQKSEFQVGESFLSELMKRANVTFEYEIEEILRKDSLDLTDEDRKLIYETIDRCSDSKVIVTHGTDTMAQTGKFLQGIRGKTIVLTGSMQPARFQDSDAIFNVGTAVSAVQCLGEGVYLSINGQIFDPSRATKNRTENRFEG